ncbi:TonB-dependent receptor [Pelomonas sp. P7]|uniref:TonB-dependent receptor n=1 Tax=Pelomonas caseinilytica TaxID=2906763 RepID=A0ABS8XBG4_9BURK|nr:TonB-dependent receptor [Pelomonas sp. P7]MCE4538284.1 TonB-dependent receptor [Pelomonas sp. P7]
MRHTPFRRVTERQNLLPHGTWLSLLLAFGSAFAADPVPVSRYAIEQPSQGMAEALRAIARQTRTSVLFEPEAVAGRVARPVSGRLSAIEAIRQALQGSGMTAELMADGAVVVKASTSAAPAGAASHPPAMLPASDRDGRFNGGEERGVQGSAQDTSTAAAGAAQERQPYELIRVEVTGSRLRRLDAEGPAPVNVYSRDEIDRSGQPNLQRFLASLTEVSASSGEGGFGTTLGQGTVQLRGLPLGSTLVLVNGRKVQGVGSFTGSVFNLNLIPMAAIERVEVVPLGSSAVYGGDALAGVVNVILKKAINGQSFTGRVGSGRGFSDGSLSLATGGRSAEGEFLLMGSYSRSSPLTMQQREFFRDADYRRFGSTDERMSYCVPGTVRSVTGNLPGLNGNVAAIPDVAAGQPLKVSDFVATAGAQNLCNVWTTGGGVALFHGYETLALHALGEHKILGSWSAFTELTYTRDRMHAPDVGLRLGNVTVPAGNPFNPFGVDVRVTAALSPDNGTEGLSRQTHFTRALVGVRGELGLGWDAEVSASTTSDRGGSQTWNEAVNSAALTAALASTTPATALNPFTSGRVASDTVLRGIWSDNRRHSVGRKDQVSGQARGTLIDLPAGAVDAVVGAEAARDAYDVSSSTETHGSRTSSAAYGELRAPLLRAGGEAGGGWSLAALTLAGRRDHYSDFGSANTFQGGLELRPTRSLLIRGSAASSFKPPTILQTHVNDIVYQASIFRLVDPARGGEPITSGTVVRTTNHDLVPEHGQARGLGVVWEPEGGQGTRFSLTHWQMRIRDMIAVLPTQSALDYENLFPGLVTREPAVNGQPGAVTSVKSTEVNFGRLDTSGTDVDVAYVWKTAMGKLTAAGGASRTDEYRVVLAPGAAAVDRLGRRFRDFWAPRWKGRLSFGLDQGSWNLGLTGRYLGRYKDIGTSERRLGDYWMHDLAGSLDLKKLWPDLLPGFRTASLGASVANLTDREPQFAQGAPYYDVTQADWRGRYVSVRLSLDW